ncbi:unnamed protein product [Phytophthora lilii]|uniref:Unnamed protein product n=1 Tax=Phytophthora lilii TaxID=2077276 RepID=A0A9W6TSC2_9STRA|nr:unnamed protein product [Phytophthora lilii]
MLVGKAGSSFVVKIDDGASAIKLKTAINNENKNDFKMFDADMLQIFWAKKDGVWLSTVQGDSGLKESLAGMSEPSANEIHVLVVLTQTQYLGKRTRSDKWFVEPTQTKRSLTSVDDDGQGRITKCFKMVGFPPLENPNCRCMKIMERDAYAVIFAELMKKAKVYFKRVTDCKMMVTGNSGTGKSRFYLYCIFHLIFRTKVQVKDFPFLKLVLNCGNKYHIFDAERQEFIALADADVNSLQTENRVIWLIEGHSSWSGGWHGVSILFATPESDSLGNFRGTMPVWTLEELCKYNLLIGAVLSDDVLFLRGTTNLEGYLDSSLPRVSLTEQPSCFEQSLIQCAPSHYVCHM